MKKIFGFISVILTFVCVVSCSSSSSPSAVVEKYVKSMMDEDYQTAMDLFYFSSEDAETIEKNKEMQIAIFDRFVKPEFDKNGGIKDYLIGEVDISEDGTMAVVEFEYIYGNDKVEPVTSKLKKIDGKWYLDSGK